MDVQGDVEVDDLGRYFIDRDGALFAYILEYLRDGQLPDVTVPSHPIPSHPIPSHRS